MATKKRKLASTGAAIALAAMLLIGGGTFAYLQSTTNDVVNEFATNQVKVELAETTGSEYNVVPGTEQAKDPKVTVTNSVDSYVYVEVTDTTDGLVGWEIADGWTLLDGYDNVYYREVANDADPKVFSVLKGDKVTYDAALENSDMIDEDGKLKEGIELTFKAYAIQQEGFENAVDAYALAQYPNAIDVSTTEELEAAIADGKTVVLKNDIELPATIEIDGGEANIVGNGNKISVANGKDARVLNINAVKEPVVLNIKNAEIIGPTEGTYTRGISAYGNTDLTINIEDSKVSANYYGLNIASENENVQVNVKNSTLEGWAAVQTHSANTKATFDNCTLIGLNDKSQSEWNTFATVVINQAGVGSEFTFNNCRIEATQTTGNIQDLISIRADSTVNLNNCTFVVDGVEISSADVAANEHIDIDDDVNAVINIK